MKAYKLEIIVVDHDLVGGDGIRYHLENTKYPNYCISPNVISIKEADIGEWSDDHPLNKLDTPKEQIDSYFI
jgi:hypothetical protein